MTHFCLHLAPPVAEAARRSGGPCATWFCREGIGSPLDMEESVSSVSVADRLPCPAAVKNSTEGVLQVL
jgi:hypothetical protein